MQPLKSIVHWPGSQRRMLMIGFGILLLLMGLVTYRANQTLLRIQSANENIRREMMRRDDLLDGLRSDVFRAGIEVRDYLLDLDAASDDGERGELQARQAQITAALMQYEQGMEPAEAGSVRQLDQGVAEYWKTVTPAFGWSADYRRLHGSEFLRAEMLPRRRNLLQLVDEIAAIDTRQMQAGQDSMAAVQKQLRGELAESSLLIIGIGLLVGVVSVRHVTRLEGISGKQYQQVVEARGELRRLNARLMAAEEDERRRISRELHDEVGQHLSAVLIELGSVESALPPGDSPLLRRLESARRVAEASIAKVRDLALLLRPSMLDDLGLVAAIRWQAREVARRTGVSVDVASEEIGDDLPTELRTCIYRVVQESLNNAVRHARPGGVRITLRQQPEELYVSVQDDGTGFDPHKEKGMGMLGMQERVQNLGGLLHIDSERGGGTVVSVMLPLNLPQTLRRSA